MAHTITNLGVIAAEEVVQGAGFLDFAHDAGFAEYIILLVLVVGLALVLQWIVKRHNKNKGDTP